jgi:predicted nucleic acid-binding protein
MAEFVLDASVAISWCFPGDATEDTPYSRQILGLLAIHDALVPEIWGFEIANCIFVSFSKRRRISEPQIQEYLQRLKALPISVQALGLWAAVDLESHARKWNITAYDAAYLVLALQKSIPLATTDDDLRKAARVAGVKILNQ